MMHVFKFQAIYRTVSYHIYKINQSYLNLKQDISDFLLNMHNKDVKRNMIWTKFDPLKVLIV